jgi:hypothetical protein
MGTAQARVVLGVLVLGLLGGSAELARCPQLVSFSRASLPVPVEAQSSSDAGAMYQPVAFHPSRNASGDVAGDAHQTLLKATMPVDNRVRPVSQPAVKHRRVAAAPAVHRTTVGRTAMERSSGLTVLTSWDGFERRETVVSVNRGRLVFTSYAAVPTAGGWLVIQL